MVSRPASPLAARIIAERQKELSGLRQQYIVLAKKQEAEVVRLIQVKAEKLANNLLMRDRHTQLSYLKGEEREAELAIVKSAICERLIRELNLL